MIGEIGGHVSFWRPTPVQRALRAYTGLKADTNAPPFLSNTLVVDHAFFNIPSNTPRNFHIIPYVGDWACFGPLKISCLQSSTFSFKSFGMLKQNLRGQFWWTNPFFSQTSTGVYSYLDSL